MTAESPLIPEAVMHNNEEESLLANRPSEEKGLLQAGDFETTESPGPKQGRDIPPDFLDLPNNAA